MKFRDILLKFESFLRFFSKYVMFFVYAIMRFLIVAFIIKSFTDAEVEIELYHSILFNLYVIYPIITHVYYEYFHAFIYHEDTEE